MKNNNSDFPVCGDRWVANKTFGDPGFVIDKISLSVPKKCLNTERFGHIKGMRSITTQLYEPPCLYGKIHIHAEHINPMRTLRDNIKDSISLLQKGDFFISPYSKSLETLMSCMNPTELEVAYSVNQLEVVWFQVHRLVEEGSLTTCKGTSFYSADYGRTKSFLILYNRFEALQQSIQPDLGVVPGTWRLEARFNKHDHFDNGRPFPIGKPNLYSSEWLDETGEDFVALYLSPYLRKKIRQWMPGVFIKPVLNKKLNAVL